MMEKKKGHAKHPAHLFSKNWKESNDCKNTLRVPKNIFLLKLNNKQKTTSISKNSIQQKINVLTSSGLAQSTFSREQMFWFHIKYMSITFTFTSILL